MRSTCPFALALTLMSSEMTSCAGSSETQPDAAQSVSSQGARQQDAELSPPASPPTDAAAARSKNTAEASTISVTGTPSSGDAGTSTGTSESSRARSEVPSAPTTSQATPDNSDLPGAAAGSAATKATDAGVPPRQLVENLSDQVLATWGSSVCDGYSVPSGTAWPWTLEEKFAAIGGPKVSHVSTPGHNTDSKDSAIERRKVAGANFVVVCLSLGNQGLGSATTDGSAQAVVDSYLDDIFTDHDDSDGDPESMVDYIQSLGAYPIVTLVYPMAGYNTMHCKHVVEANIAQQSYGFPTINHLGATNAGNNFADGDCTWANGLNAPVNVQSDARHPNQAGHDEDFYAFPPDLPFALASNVPFPMRPAATDYLALTPEPASDEPVRYTPQYAIHHYTLQFGFSAASDGTLASIDCGMDGFVSVELLNGEVHLIMDDAKEVLHGTVPASADPWHDVAVSYSYVRQKLSFYVDGALIGEHDTRAGTSLRDLFPQSFILGGPAASGRAAAPNGLQLRDMFVNRAALHAREIEERANTDWVGAGSLDVYAPLRASQPTENRAQTLQLVHVDD